MAQKSASQQVQELRDLLVAYAKQETVQPMKRLGRYVAWGAAGALLTGMGVVFLAVGFLRLLQGFDAFDGASWASVLAYLVVIGTLGVLAGFTMLVLRPRATRQLQRGHR